MKSRLVLFAVIAALICIIVSLSCQKEESGGKPQLTFDCAQLNADIEALSEMIQAIDEEILVNKVEDKDGKFCVGFKDADVLRFNKTYSGEVANPRISVRRLNGVLCWVADSKYIKDADGANIPAVGEKAAVPEVKIKDGRWFASVDGVSWIDLGEVVSGSTMPVVKSVVNSNGKVSVTLCNDTSFTVNFYFDQDDDDDDDEGGTEGGDDGDDEGGDDDVPSPVVTSSGWAELPVVRDADGNGIDDKDATLYYASHSFKSGSKSMRNYTVCYSSAQHCPVWVAAPRHKCYVGSTGRSNAYSRDPKIPSGIQYSSKETGGGCNKGHMLGSAERTCNSEANKQVFYYTNIAPQLSSGFNTGGGGWNTLEDWVDGKVCNDTLYVVIGAYFKTFTDGYGKTVNPKTISFGGRNDVAFPTMFYYILLRTKSGKTGKAVKDCSASELQCAAFVRSHTNSLKGQEVTSKELMKVSDLEKITGFTYFPNVPNAPKSTLVASDWGL